MFRFRPGLRPLRDVFNSVANDTVPVAHAPDLSLSGKEELTGVFHTLKTLRTAFKVYNLR